MTLPVTDHIPTEDSIDLIKQGMELVAKGDDEPEPAVRRVLIYPNGRVVVDAGDKIDGIPYYMSLYAFGENLTKIGQTLREQAMTDAAGEDDAWDYDD